MTVLKNTKGNIGHFWKSLSNDWSQLVERATKAITRYTPIKKDTGTEDFEWGDYIPRLGVLPSEVMERDDDVLVRLEAPGLDAEDFKIEVISETLVVRGEKRMERSERRGRYHVTECAYGSFQRNVPLPAQVDVAKAKAKYRNGVLLITLPKTAGERGRRVAVEVK